MNRSSPENNAVLENSSSDPVAQVHEVGPDSPYLSAVQLLWRTHSATLGFFPAGAFEEYARKRMILAAVAADGQFAGYLLYRRAHDRVSIVHLCVCPERRGTGLANLLVEELAKRSKNLRGISLTCRRDFDAHKVWPKLGFVPINEKIGRSKQGLELTLWWRDNHIDDLVTRCQPPPAPDGVLAAVLDANVFFDLVGRNTPREESLALNADWVRSKVELRLTEEILTEINRSENSVERKEQRLLAEEFGILRCDLAEFQAYENALRPLFPESLSTQDASDLRQLARAIACDADVFVTRDDALLDLSDEVYGKFSISILRPSDLIVRIDELLREKEYQPARLAGPHLKSSRVSNGKEQAIADLFHFSEEGKKVFLAKFRNLQAAPRLVDLRLVEMHANAIALMVYDRRSDGELEVPFLRIKRHALSGTLSRHLLVEAVRTAALEGRSVTRLTEQFVDSNVLSALSEIGFVKSSGGWIKFSLNLSASLVDVMARASNLVARALPDDADLRQLVSTRALPKNAGEPAAVAALERALWPAKITDARLPVFLVPIKRGWAEQLFDHEAASQMLFGAEPSKALGIEGAYYRDSRQRIVSAPGRILWYVSDQKGGSGAVRACSYLDEVVVDEPKALFRRFRRLGVYRWQDVREKASRNPANEVMVMRFSGTELFRRPINWSAMQRILRANGVKTQVQSPIKIEPSVFFEIYHAAMERV